MSGERAAPPPPLGDALPAKVYANEGIAQVLFFEADADDECEVSYADKQGTYQAQRGVTLPKL